MPDTLEDPAQLELEIRDLVIPDRVPEETIQEAFEAFDDANPWVYGALVKLARDWQARGRERIGIGMLVEVLRWQYGRRTTSRDRFRINNNYRSRYVRKMVNEYPDLAPAFELRELRSA